MPRLLCSQVETTFTFHLHCINSLQEVLLAKRDASDTKCLTGFRVTTPSSSSCATKFVQDLATYNFVVMPVHRGHHWVLMVRCYFLPESSLAFCRCYLRKAIYTRILKLSCGISFQPCAYHSSMLCTPGCLCTSEDIDHLRCASWNTTTPAHLLSPVGHLHVIPSSRYS